MNGFELVIEPLTHNGKRLVPIHGKGAHQVRYRPIHVAPPFGAKFPEKAEILVRLWGSAGHKAPNIDRRRA